MKHALRFLNSMKSLSVISSISMLRFIKSFFAIVFCIMSFNELSFAQETVIYSEGFETDDGGFTIAGGAYWEWGTPGYWTTANSGTKCFATNLDGGSGSAAGSITSPAIAIPALSSDQVARARFYANINVNMVARGQFMVSPDGITWTVVAQYFMTMQGKWDKYEFDVSEFSGKNLYLRFYLTGARSTDPGFYIDDIAVTVYNKAGDSKLLTLEARENASGSCPWIFPWNGTSYEKDNDIYSVARYTAGEYKDYYKLTKPLVAENGKYKLEIREVESEESFSDYISLVAVDHASDVKIAPDNFGNIFAYQPANLITPVSAVNNSGTDILDQIKNNDRDGFHAYSENYIDLDFGDADVSGGARLFLKVKGFNDDGIGKYMPFIGPPAIVVQYLNPAGKWTELGRLKPRFEWSECMFDLSPFMPDYQGDVKIRLYSISHGQKYHIIDYVAVQIGTEPAKTVIPQELSRATFYENSVLQTLNTSDNDYVHMKAGNHIPIEFEATPATDEDRTFIFVSEGYYIPRGSTYFIYTWDGSNWINRDAYSYTNIDETKVYDLSLFLPDPDGEYKVRVWQDYTGGYAAAIDYVDFEVGSLEGTLTSAIDLRDNQNVLSQAEASDDLLFTLNSGFGYTGQRDRWSEYVWTGLPTNYPPSANSLKVNGNTLTWAYSDNENDPQTKAEIEIWSSAGGVGTLIWDPPLLEGTQSEITYSGSDLVRGQEYFYRIKVSDGNNWSAWKETSFVIVNNPPVANDDSYPSYCGETVSGNVLDNDSDAEGNEFAVATVPALSQGSFESFNLETGDFVYRAPIDYAGELTFSYQATDGALSDPATVTINIIDTITPILNVPADLHLYTDSDQCGTVLDYQSDTEDVVLSQSNLKCLENDDLWQSFVPEVTGMLKKVQLKHDGSYNVSITFDFYKGEGISGEHLFTRSYNLGVLGSGWFELELPTVNALNLTAGDTYSFRISGQYGFILGNFNNIYNQGRMTYRSDWDLCFKTYMAEGLIAYDNTEDIEIRQTKGLSSGSVFPVGETINTFVIMDNSGNLVEKSFSITVEDTVPPEALAQNVTVQLDENGNGSTTAATVDNGSNDACGIASLELSQTDFDCSHIGTNDVILTVTDKNGNVSTAPVVVTVEDNIPPEALAQNVTVQLDETGTGSTSAAAVDKGSNDACGIASVELSQTDFDCSHVGTNNVTLTVTDNNGNVSTASAVVAVEDNIKPVVLTKAITVQLDHQGLAVLDSMAIDNGSNDACGLANFELSKDSFDCGDIGMNKIYMTVTDINGNSTIDSAVVSIEDNLAPKVVARDMEVYLDSSGIATISIVDVDAGTKDNCALDSMFLSRDSFDCSVVEIQAGFNELKNAGSHTLTKGVEVWLTAVDKNGNYAKDLCYVTVRDTIAPVIQTKDTVIALGEDGIEQITPSMIIEDAYDACGIESIVLNKSTFRGEDVGANKIILTATDINGNISVCTSFVTVKDTIPPVLSCRNIGVVLDQEGKFHVYAPQLVDQLYDAGGIASATLDKYYFHCTDVGDHLATLKVQDYGGNAATCNATVHVYDRFAPQVLCNDMEVYLNEDGVASINPSMIDAGSDDECGIGEMKLSQSLFTGANLGVNKITLYIVDIHGNESSCEATVIVKDSIAPVASCHSIDIPMTGITEYELTSSDILHLAEGSFDNATIFESLKIEVMPKVFDCENIGDSVLVTISISDEAGNASIGEANVYVQSPFEEEPEDIQISLPIGICETTIEYPAIFTNKSCATFRILDGLGPDGIFPVGTSEENWEVVKNGVVDTISFSVQVSATNRIPTLDSIADINALENEELMVSLSGISDGGDCRTQQLNVTATSANTELIESIDINYESNDSSALMLVTLVANQTGEALITVQVEDEEGAAFSDTFELSVLPLNRAPQLIAPLEDQALREDEVLELVMSKKPNEYFTDPDGDDLEWSVYMQNFDSIPSWISTYETIGEYILGFSPSPSDTGCYSVVVKVEDMAGATATDTFNICVTPTLVGIEEMETTSFEVKIFPNPTRGKVRVEYDEIGSENVQIAVHSVSGREVFRKVYRSGQGIHFNLNGEVSGMYLVSIKYGDLHLTKKLILDKK